MLLVLNRKKYSRNNIVKLFGMNQIGMRELN